MYRCNTLIKGLHNLHFFTVRLRVFLGSTLFGMYFLILACYKMRYIWKALSKIMRHPWIYPFFRTALFTLVLIKEVSTAHTLTVIQLFPDYLSNFCHFNLFLLTVVNIPETQFYAFDNLSCDALLVKGEKELAQSAGSRPQSVIRQINAGEFWWQIDGYVALFQYTNFSSKKARLQSLAFLVVFSALRATTTWAIPGFVNVGVLKKYILS